MGLHINYDTRNILNSDPILRPHPLAVRPKCYALSNRDAKRDVELMPPLSKSVTRKTIHEQNEFWVFVNLCANLCAEALTVL